MINCCICWIITDLFLGILLFKWLTARRPYKSFDVKGLKHLVKYLGNLPRLLCRVRPGNFIEDNHSFAKKTETFSPDGLSQEF
jgi:hypothetical protein